jgi:hypothetical protein
VRLQELQKLTSAGCRIYNCQSRNFEKRPFFQGFWRADRMSPAVSLGKATRMPLRQNPSDQNSDRQIPPQGERQHSPVWAISERPVFPVRLSGYRRGSGMETDFS